MHRILKMHELVCSCHVLRDMSFLILWNVLEAQNYAGSWLELHFMVQALPGRVGRLDQVFFSGVA